jgi:hypothetical protein
MKRTQVMERLPKGELPLELFVLGMAIADKQFRESLDATDFTYPLAAIVEEIQKAKPEMWKFDGWLLDALSVERAGKKVADACLERLTKNADLRELQKCHGLDAIFARLALLSQRRSRTAQLRKDYRAWEESERLKRLEAAKAAGASSEQEPAGNGQKPGTSSS